MYMKIILLIFILFNLVSCIGKQGVADFDRPEADFDFAQMSINDSSPNSTINFNIDLLLINT